MACPDIVALGGRGSSELVECPWMGMCSCDAQNETLFTISQATGVFYYGVCFPLECFRYRFVLYSDPARTTMLAAIGGPGYYSDEMARIKICPSGSYCPPNADGLYTSKVDCQVGTFCFQGAIREMACSWFESCDGSAIYAFTGGAVIIGILIFTSLICVFGTIFRQRRVMQESRKLAAEHRDDDISSDHSVFGANFKFDIQPTTIEFENVGLTLKNAPKGTPPILSGVTGRIPPASLTALMGPSGCGKTTFMNAILGRTNYGVRCGTIKVNGVPDALVRSRGLVGFVPQDDIVHGSMTVYQNLYYHAELRLPRSTTKEMKMEHVQHVINVLGLSKVQDAVVGTPERRGVSGGQKKRVNIGLELVSMPSVLFMDEPTSGLDGASTVGLGACLGLMAKFGLTIVCVIHQPRWVVFDQFTHVLLLGEGGKTVYCGRKQHLVTYLTELGYQRPEFENPADWMIDVCSNLCQRIDPATSAVDATFTAPDDLYKIWAQEHQPKALQPGFRWYKGDTTPELKPLVLTKTVIGAPAAMYKLMVRAWLELDVSAEVIGLLLPLAAAVLAIMRVVITLATGGESTWTWTSMVQTLSAPGNSLFYLTVVLKHKNDFGSIKLITLRELDAGIHALAIWWGKFIVMFALCSIKSLMYAAVVYMFLTPVQNFGTFWLSYLLGTLCWASFSQWLSLCSCSQVCITMLLLVWVLLEPLWAGQLCIANPASPQEPLPGVSAFCARVMSKSIPPFSMSVSRYSFQLLWGAELEALDAPYAVNLSTTPVNFTNYWRALVPKDDLQDPNYNQVLGSAIGALIWLFIVHQAIVVALLFLGKTSVKAAIASTTEPCKNAYANTCVSLVGCFSSLFGCCSGHEEFGYGAPPDELRRSLREASKADPVLRTSKNGVPGEHKMSSPLVDQTPRAEHERNSLVLNGPLAPRNATVADAL